MVLLAHPDHLRRALRIGGTAFAASDDLRGVSGCQGLRLVPAMQPYRVDWPQTSERPSPSSPHSYWSSLLPSPHCAAVVPPSMDSVGKSLFDGTAIGATSDQRLAVQVRLVIESRWSQFASERQRL